jgi:uncharacterized protein (DUF608 family)
VASPTVGYQVTLNTPWYAGLVDNYWLLHGDEAFLREFYPSVRKSIEFMVGLNRGPDGLISMPDRMVSVWEFPYETEVYEWAFSTGMSPHVGGIHLAALQLAERLAQAAGDGAFAAQCRAWIAAGTDSLEGKTWLGDYYLRYWDQDTGERSDVVFSVQLDGEWIARLHGLKGVFQSDRVRAALETIKRTCVAATQMGALHQTTPEGAPVVAGITEGAYPASEVYPASAIHLGLAYMYAGQTAFGLEVIRRMLRNYTCEQGLTWYGASSFNAMTGEFVIGTEYAMLPLLWAILAARKGKDITAPSRSGGIVDRIIRAALGPVESGRAGDV